MEYTTPNPWRKANGHASGLNNGHAPPLNGGAAPKDAHRRRAFQRDLPEVLRVITQRLTVLENNKTGFATGWGRGPRPDITKEIDRLVRIRLTQLKIFRNSERPSGVACTARSVSAARLPLWPTDSTASSIGSLLFTCSEHPDLTGAATAAPVRFFGLH